MHHQHKDLLIREKANQHTREIDGSTIMHDTLIPLFLRTTSSDIIRSVVINHPKHGRELWVIKISVGCIGDSERVTHGSYTILLISFSESGKRGSHNGNSSVSAETVSFEWFFVESFHIHECFRWKSIIELFYHFLKNHHITLFSLLINKWISRIQKWHSNE